MMKIYAALAMVGAGLIVAGVWVWTERQRLADPYSDCRGGVVAGGSVGGPFTLVDETGRTVTETDAISKPSLVYFGYSFCPDVCPLDNQRNAETVDILEESGFDVTPIFVSVDPERDTPEVLLEYTDLIHPKLIGLTGSLDQVRAASAAYKTYFKKLDDDPEFYTVDHTTLTYFVSPTKGFLDFFERDVTADEMAKRVGCFLGKD